MNHAADATTRECTAHAFFDPRLQNKYNPYGYRLLTPTARPDSISTLLVFSHHYPLSRHGHFLCLLVPSRRQQTQERCQRNSRVYSLARRQTSGNQTRSILLAHFPGHLCVALHVGPRGGKHPYTITLPSASSSCAPKRV